MIAETLWIILLAASGFASAFVAEQLFRWSLERWGLEKEINEETLEVEGS